MYDILTCWSTWVSKLRTDCSCFSQSKLLITNSSPLVVVTEFYTSFWFICTSNQPNISSSTNCDIQLYDCSSYQLNLGTFSNHTGRWWLTHNTSIFRVITVVCTRGTLAATIDKSVFRSNTGYIIKIDGPKPWTICNSSSLNSSCT